MKPRYKHDCDICKLVGQIGRYDIYVHPDSTQLVARFGEDGDYLSYSEGVLDLYDEHITIIYGGSIVGRRNRMILQGMEET